jgi:hypothetical protein
VADVYFAFRDETQVLQLLINFIRSPERDASYYALLNKAELSYERPTEIKLGLTTERSTRKARDAFIRLFEEVTTDSAETWLDGTWEPIASGLVHLIARHASPDIITHNDQQTIDEANGLNRSEYLLIYEGVGKIILQQFRKLMERRDRQTQLRVAFAKGNNGKQYTLFWIKDDETRQSLYQGLRAGGSITLAEARAFEVNLPQDTHTYRFFLPFDSTKQVSGNLPSIEKPHIERLRLLCELMMIAPELFGATLDKNIQTDVIGAVYQPDANLEASELLYLAGLEFLSDNMILSDPNQLNLEVVALKTDPRFTQKLRNVLEGRAGRSGYRVELRRAKYSNSMTQDQRKIEYARLKSERSRVQDRLAQMDGLKQLHPILLRFSLNRTALLMDTLASYRPQDLNNLYYCFYEGVTDKPDRSNAYHYLYIPPDVDRQLSDTLIVNDTQPDNPMSFWLDPYWAGSYHDKCLSEVFVPQGLLFSPPLHSWENTDMDTYLRERFRPLNPPEGQRLFYVFHKTSHQSPDSKVVASVLDFSAFRNFGDANVIGWINDNLILLSQLNTMQQDISTIADQTRREQFASLITESATEAMNEATRAQNLAQHTMQQHTDDMMLTIESEFNKNIESTRNAIEKARDMNQRLVDVEGLYETTDRRLKETDRAIETTRKLVDEVTKRVSRLREDVETTIQQAQTTRDEQHVNLENEIVKMQSKYRELVQEIRRLEDLL